MRTYVTSRLVASMQVVHGYLLVLHFVLKLDVSANSSDVASPHPCISLAASSQLVSVPDSAVRISNMVQCRHWLDTVRELSSLVNTTLEHFS